MDNDAFIEHLKKLGDEYPGQSYERILSEKFGLGTFGPSTEKDLDEFHKIRDEAFKSKDISKLENKYKELMSKYSLEVQTVLTFELLQVRNRING
jgi:hypothetical protein